MTPATNSATADRLDSLVDTTLSLIGRPFLPLIDVLMALWATRVVADDSSYLHVDFDTETGICSVVPASEMSARQEGSEEAFMRVMPLLMGLSAVIFALMLQPYAGPPGLLALVVAISFAIGCVETLGTRRYELRQVTEVAG